MITNKKMLSLLLTAVMFSQTSALADFEWATEAVDYCIKKEVLTGTGDGELALGNNLTREQMAKILVDAFDLQVVVDEENPDSVIMPYADIEEGRWSYGYISAFSPYMKKKNASFNPE